MGKIPILNTLFIGIFILTVGAILLYVYNRLTVREGFADIPTASQTSFIPKDTPGATTSDPTITKPDAREVIDAQEAVDTFKNIYQPDKTGVRADSGPEVTELMNRAPAFMKVLESFLEDPDNTATSDDIMRMASKFRKANEKFRDSSDAEPFSEDFVPNMSVTTEGFENPPNEPTLAAAELDTVVAEYKTIVDLFKTLYSKANLSKLTADEQQYMNTIKNAPLPNDEMLRLQLVTKRAAMNQFIAYYNFIVTLSRAVPKQTTVPSSDLAIRKYVESLKAFRKAYNYVDVSKDTDSANANKRKFAKDMYEKDKTDNFSDRDLKTYIDIYGGFLTKLNDETLAYLNSLPLKNPQATNQGMPATQPTASAQPAASTQPTIIGSSSGHLSMEDLKLLLRNVESENLRLANLRSTSPNILVRRERLSKLAADLRDILLRIDRKQMSLKDVPIRVEDARRFLSALQAGQNPEEELLGGKPIPTTKTTVNGKGGPNMTALPMDKMATGMPTQEIFEALQGLKWSLDVKLDYDPAIGERSRIMKRLKEIEEKITAYAYSETPIPRNLQKALMKEISTLSAALSQSLDEDNDRILDTRFPTAYSTRMEPGNGASYPSDMNTSFTPGFFREGKRGGGPRGSYDNDTKIRPGFTMNSETIAHRASASAFDESLVGGLDYKQRTQDLCRQIRGANLGDPANFGCITNPSEVSADYSWKGAHRMICNRLGDTWGSWYPEMFGCGPYDPQAKYKGAGL